MRTHRCVLLLSLGTIAACSADRPTSPSAVPAQPHLFAEVNLSLTGATPLYSSTALGINDSGVVVGYAQLAQSDEPKAAVWRPPDYRVTILPDLGPRGTSRANAIGNDGTIGGEVCDGSDPTVPCHPSYWRDGILHELAGLGEVRDVCPCDGHTLVGRTIVNGRDHGAIWVHDVLIDVGIPDVDHSGSVLVAVSHGYIVGNEYNGTEETYQSRRMPFRWSPASGWVSLGGVENFVLDVNSDGSAVGVRALFWPNGAATPTFVTRDGDFVAINDRGTIAGFCGPIPSGQEATGYPCEWTSATGWVQIGNEPGISAIALNNSNAAVGTDYNTYPPAGILWRP